MTAHDDASERIERAALLSLHDHCPAASKEALGLFLIPTGDGVVAGAARDGSILLNRTLGLATQQAWDPTSVPKVVEAYARHGVTRYFVHLYDAALGEDGLRTLPEAGLERCRGWMKFHRPPAPSPADLGRTDLRVERVGPDRGDDFGRVVCEAFGMTDAAIGLLGGLTRDPRWHCFVSYDGDEPAGAGGLMVDGGIAFLEWGATRPKFRRRGSQGAIMNHRISAAVDAGCSALYTETGEQVEGDPQHSYRNILRYGFVEGQLRGNWAPPR